MSAARVPVPRGPLAPRDPTLAKARREAIQVTRIRVHLDVVRTLRAVEHARARWHAGAEIAADTLEAVFASLIAVLDDVGDLLVQEIAAEEKAEEGDKDDNAKP